MSRDPDCYVEAPNYYEPIAGETAVFLAGGITGCPRWHDDAAYRLMTADVPVVVLNPNRENFPIHDPEAGWEQVQWEQHHLHLPNVITMMWFPPCDAAVTTQPIAQFELGQALGEGRWLLVGADPGYPRKRDVHLMLRYNRPDLTVHDSLDALLDATIAAVRGDRDE